MFYRQTIARHLGMILANETLAQVLQCSKKRANLICLYGPRKLARILQGARSVPPTFFTKKYKFLLFIGLFGP